LRRLSSRSVARFRVLSALWRRAGDAGATRGGAQDATQAGTRGTREAEAKAIVPVLSYWLGFETVGTRGCPSRWS
jgi:hypothetical protein